MSKRHERLRFSAEDDLHLLREVIDQNPFEEPDRWSIITTNVGRSSSKQFTQRSIKEHVDYMLKLFLNKEDWASRKRSGTKEQFAEKELLLQNILDLRQEFKPRKQMKKEHVSQSNAGLKLREDTTSSFFEEKSQADSEIREEVSNEEGTSPIVESQSNVLAPSYKRRKRKADLQKSILSYLREKHQAELKMKWRQIEIEEKKLALEERKLTLEEARFAIEKEQRAKQLEMERSRKEAHHRFMQQNMELMSLLD